MGRGLGKVQRAILDTLEERGKMHVKMLAWYVYHPEYIGANGWPKNEYAPWDISSSEWASISRAVRTLEERGLVNVEQGAPVNAVGLGNAKLKWVSVK